MPDTRYDGQYWGRQNAMALDEEAAAAEAAAAETGVTASEAADETPECEEPQANTSANANLNLSGRALLEEVRSSHAELADMSGNDSVRVETREAPRGPSFIERENEALAAAAERKEYVLSIMRGLAPCHSTPGDITEDRLMLEQIAYQQHLEATRLQIQIDTDQATISRARAEVAAINGEMAEIEREERERHRA